MAQQDLTLPVVNMQHVVDNILDLFPGDTVPVEVHDKMCQIMVDLALVKSYVGAVKATLGTGVAMALKGDHTVLDRVYDALMRIETADTKSRYDK